MPELFTLAETQVLVGVMFQFYGTSWDLSLGNKKFLILLKYLAHMLRMAATDEMVKEYVDMVGEDMFWHVCDALWKEDRLPIPAPDKSEPMPLCAEEADYLTRARAFRAVGIYETSEPSMRPLGM